MRHINKKIFLPLFVVPFMCSCVLGVTPNGQNGGNNNNNNNVPANNLGPYYETIDITDFGQTLVESLHSLMWRTHTQQIKYSNWYNYEKPANFNSIDQVPGTNKNQLFYSGEESSGYGNREHVWPCANSSQLWDHAVVDASGYSGGGSDLYHVRPCNGTVNTARGNGKYVDFDDFPALKSDVVYITKTGYKTTDPNQKALTLYGATLKANSTTVYEYAQKVEVNDNFKGDVARIIAYIWLHYQITSTTPQQYKSQTASLSLTNVIGYGTEEKCKEVLCAWNKLDPVSEVEKLRNNTVQQAQGNRNPFVDYPDFMDSCFGIL